MLTGSYDTGLSVIGMQAESPVKSGNFVVVDTIRKTKTVHFLETATPSGP
uniref:Uncharacterized protein n=1 Tax=Arion vulgaris TaxID=1028688 RepID=A0A0B6XV84_9EUPU